MTTVSFMLAVEDAAEASAWYERAMDAKELWSLGSVRALEIEGVCVLLHEHTDGFDIPSAAGTTTVRLEIFSDNPDSLLARAIEAGACDSDGKIHDYETPWGPHRQGGFSDPYGHRWLVGDKAPLTWRGAPPES
jgi:uncharacterized glyoxalase superfamily protein PhnB